MTRWEHFFIYIWGGVWATIFFASTPEPTLPRALFFLAIYVLVVVYWLWKAKQDARKQQNE